MRFKITYVDYIEAEDESSALEKFQDYIEGDRTLTSEHAVIEETSEEGKVS